MEEYCEEYESNHVVTVSMLSNMNKVKQFRIQLYSINVFSLQLCDTFFLIPSI